MTQEEFEKNLEEGRAWLRRHGWLKYIDSDEYWKHPDGWGEMWEPVKESPYVFWKCYINYDEDLEGQLDTAERYTETTGTTPFEAMQKAMFDWDAEMRRRHDEIFKSVIDEIKEQADKMIEAMKLSSETSVTVDEKALANMNKSTFSAMGLGLSSVGFAMSEFLNGTLDGQHDSNESMMKSAPEMFEFICDLVSACDYGTEELSHDFRVRADKIICEVYGRRYVED